MSIRVFIFALLSAFIITGCEKAGTGSSTGDSLYSGGISAPGPGGGPGGGQPGVLTAGEWNDLEHWDFWTGLMDTSSYKDQQAYWNFFTKNRFSVALTDAAGKKLVDCAVFLYNPSGTKVYAARTDNFGRAELFALLHQQGTATGTYTAKAEQMGVFYDLGGFNLNSPHITKQLPVNRSFASLVDVMYVVDATGSMGDEISYLKTELNDVLNRSLNELPGTTIRAASVFYRDRDDDYITREKNFTSDIGSVTSFIQQQGAAGGGDFPEAVETALEKALQQNWSSSAIAKIIFLVLDAPPHYTPDIVNKLHNITMQCAERGIKLIPIVSSGSDKHTEFLTRFMAIATNGTYVFLTDHSGIGGTHTVPTVGPYTVEFLNNLMVRLIKKYGVAG